MRYVYTAAAESCLTKIERKAQKSTETRQFRCLSSLVKAPKCLFDSRKLIEITSSPLLTNICAIKGLNFQELLTVYKVKKEEQNFLVEIIIEYFLSDDDFFKVLLLF